MGGANDSVSLTFSHGYFDQGGYTAWPASPSIAAGFSIGAGFFDEQTGIVTASDGQSDNFGIAAAAGQATGGVNSGESISFSFDDFQSGQYGGTIGNFWVNGSYLHDQEKGSDSSFANSGGQGEASKRDRSN